MASLQCVDCGHTPLELLEQGTVQCGQCGRVFVRAHGIVVMWPKDMPALAREEAEHHDHDGSNAVEEHQLHRPRNWYYHERLWAALNLLPVGAEILEVGAGTGFDAEKLIEKYRLTLTDVSPHTLERLAERLNAVSQLDVTRATPTCITAEGTKLPFVDHAFAGMYMVATLHHLPNPAAGIKEAARVLHSEGRLVIAVEPNATYFRAIKRWRSVLCRAIHTDPHAGSHADAEMTGFSYRELVNLFPRDTWREVHIQPMWLLAGWWHYGAEFLFRSLRLKKRLVLPSALEWLLIYVDEFLFKIPGVKHLGWHWSIFATRL